MLSLSVPRLTSLATTSSNFTSHRRHLLRRKPLSVSVSAASSNPSLRTTYVKLSPRLRRFQLGAGPESAELDDEFEEVEEGLEEEVETGPVEVEEAEGSSGDSYEFLEGGELVEEVEEEDEEVEYDEEDERAIRAQMVLKFIWMEKNIGLALEKVVPGGKGSIPLTPYYFWPRKDAWEELKAVLEEKRWVSQKRMIILLNQATDIINLWQQSGAPTPTL